jgi:hypothetical protein
VNVLLAAGTAGGGLWVWLGGGVSVSILIAAVIKVGRWVGSVESRLSRHDRDLQRIGKALTGNHEVPREERSS